ncbi:LOW QUALITY PROTEIN: hypothetical protein, conserved [Eimeria necatrix]|uniref:Uncharacterized protein n=1 Tax=Eimeria necatrix TaxID=51315 RepID=U6MPY2_9EIME|nr:LOW QUALITY PROTEIN: hypothetical protein, conserved [Eimeria necatrix]CDJ66287.1 hypothetical protein, conserved [Eimeria necatrix]
MGSSSPEAYEDTLPLRELPTETSLGESETWDLYSSASEGPRSYETSPASDEQLSWIAEQQTESRSTRGAPPSQGPQPTPPGPRGTARGRGLPGQGGPQAPGGPPVEALWPATPELGGPPGGLGHSFRGTEGQ